MPAFKMPHQQIDTKAPHVSCLLAWACLHARHRIISQPWDEADEAAASWYVGNNMSCRIYVYVRLELMTAELVQ
jgi:hypothetical protein